MLISETIFVLFSLILVFGHGQKVDLSQHKDLILKLHNGYRGIQRSANMKKIEWSHTLAKEAEKWVARCWYQFLAGTHGENMFYFESALADEVLIERAIDTWYGEKYNWRRSGDCTDACSYTQMVWAKTDEVGCAARRCAKLNLVEEFVPNGWFITCLYNPKGNVLGSLPFETGNPCTLCDIGERCIDNLCVKSRPEPRKVSVHNRRPPRPKIKPILTFDDVQRRGQQEFSRNGRQVPRKWWDSGPVTPSIRDFAGENIRREKVRIVEEIVTLRPTEPVPTIRSLTARKKLRMTESAFGLRSIKQKTAKAHVNNTTGDGTTGEDPLKMKSLYDDTTKRKNVSDDVPSPKYISPVYAQMTLNGPVFSFRGTVFKSHLTEHGNEKPEKTTIKEIITTTSTTTTTTTTPAPPVTRKIPKWFELKINKADDPRMNKMGLTESISNSNPDIPEKHRNTDNTEFPPTISTQFTEQKQSNYREDSFNQQLRRNNEGGDRRRNRIPTNDGPASNVRFVFKTFDSNGRRGIEEVTVYASGTTTPFPVTTAKANQSPTDGFSRKRMNKATHVPTPPPNPLLCPDNDNNCKHWKKYCNNNKYVMDNCPGSCNTCPTPPPPPTTVPTPPPCPDLDPNCHLWKAYCTHNDYVREHCFNSCNNCTNAVHVTPPPNGNVPLSSVHAHTKHSHSQAVNSEHYPTLSVTSGKNQTPQKTTCVDSDKYCPGWLNLCHTDEYVKQHCRKSCSFCR